MTILKNFLSHNFLGVRLLVFSFVAGQGGEQLASLSTVFEINNSISPAAVLKLKVMTRSGVTEVTSGVASLTEMKLFTAASEVASPSEVELYCFLFAHLQYLGLFF